VSTIVGQSSLLVILGINSYQPRACAFEIGIHNNTLAMTIALTIMASTTIAMPAAVYSIFMYIFATIFGTLITRFEK
jgi:BASS family bile acid:Na+ symporter